MLGRIKALIGTYHNRGARFVLQLLNKRRVFRWLFGVALFSLIWGVVLNLLGVGVLTGQDLVS